MTLDELLIGIGVKADTSAVTKFNDELHNTTTEANLADKSLAQTGQTASTVFGTVGKIGAVVFTALQTVIGGAWAYLNSYIDKVEELQEAEDASIRTTKEQVEMAKKYKENMSKLGDTIENIKTRVALQFLPTMYDLSEQYAKLLSDNKALIADGINRLLEAVTKLIQVINNVGRFIKLAVETTVGWKVAIGGLIIILGYLRRAMILAFITNPVTWAIAAIAALALLIDDFMTYLDGGKSQFGDFWGASIKWTKSAIVAIKEFWQNTVDNFNNIVGFVNDTINRIVNAWNRFKNAVIAIWLAVTGAIIRALTPIYNFVRDIFDSIWSVIKGYVNIFSGIFKFITSAWRGDIGGARDAIAQLVKGWRQVFDGFTKFWSTLWNGLVAGFKAYVNVVKFLWTNLVAIMKAVWNGLINGLIAIWQGYIKLLRATWTAVINGLIAGAKGAVHLVGSAFKGLFNGIISLATWFKTGIVNVFIVIGALIREPFQQAFDWIVDKFKALPNAIGGFINKATFGLSGRIMNAVRDEPRQTVYNGGATTATITVNGAGNPQAVANNVTNNLNVTAQRNVASPFRI